MSEHSPSWALIGPLLLLAACFLDPFFFSQCSKHYLEYSSVLGFKCNTRTNFDNKLQQFFVVYACMSLLCSYWLHKLRVAFSRSRVVNSSASLKNRAFNVFCFLFCTFPLFVVWNCAISVYILAYWVVFIKKAHLLWNNICSWSRTTNNRVQNGIK